MAHSETAQKKQIKSIDIIPKPGELVEGCHRQSVASDTHALAAGPSNISNNGDVQHLVIPTTLDENPLEKDLLAFL